MSDKKLTREEEADEIIRRLTAPPVKRPRILEAHWTIDRDILDSAHGLDIEKELSEILRQEIDKEILESLRALYGKGNI